MPKRFSATELWSEDWFLDMPKDYKLFWFYMLSTCDHAGFYKVNIKSFCSLNGSKVDPIKALEFFNLGKKRIRVLKDGFWFIEEFICFQYGHKLNRKNKLHDSVLNLLGKYKIDLETIKGVEQVNNSGS